MRLLAFTATLTVLVLLLNLNATAEAPATRPAVDAKGAQFFQTKILPVLTDRCYECHSAASKRLKGELRLDTRGGMLKGGESGDPAVVPGDPEKSTLIGAIRYTDEDPDRRMPPRKKGGKLPDGQIKDFEEWIKMGAPDTRAQ